MVLEVGANVWEVYDRGDIEGGELCCGAETGEEKDLRTIYGPGYIS